MLDVIWGASILIGLVLYVRHAWAAWTIQADSQGATATVLFVAVFLAAEYGPRGLRYFATVLELTQTILGVSIRWIRRLAKWLDR